MRFGSLAIAMVAGGMLASSASAQRVPFFARGGTAFDPEISVVNTGELLDAQVVVSDDLKYVTIGARPSSSRVLAMREFAFARRNNTPALGFVGGAGANGAGNGPANLLDRPGMSLLARLGD